LQSRSRRQVIQHDQPKDDYPVLLSFDQVSPVLTYLISAAL